MSGEILIRCDRITKAFGPHRVIDKLSLDIAEGEFITLLGPSGSGKTTLLMLLAGFESVSEGEILLGGRRIDELPPHRRNIGVVFQNYALFPHMTVAQNIAFPLRMRHVSKADITERVRRILDMVELASHSDRRPAQLSGGQQQRVALARSLVFEPRFVLMDEPLGALDKRLREQMQLDIRALHRRLGLTIVFVTHDQSEALTMSDRIAVFNKGYIEQIGTPEEIYDRPATRFVAEFIGEANVFNGTVRQSDTSGSMVILRNGIEIRVSARRKIGEQVTVVIRPERLKLGLSPKAVPNPICSRIHDRVYQGDHIRIQLLENDIEMIARVERQNDLWTPNSKITAYFAPEDSWVVPE